MRLRGARRHPTSHMEFLTCLRLIERLYVFDDGAVTVALVLSA